MINKVCLILLLISLLSCTTGNKNEVNKIAKKEPQPINYDILFLKSDYIKSGNDNNNNKPIGYWFTTFNIHLDENKAILEKFETWKALYINEFGGAQYEKGDSLIRKLNLNVEKYNKIKYYLDSITSIYRNETPAFRSHPDDYVISITKNDSTYSFNLSFLNDTTTYKSIVYEFSDYLSSLSSSIDKDSL